MNGEQTLKSTKRGFPIREDCWSEEASYTLIEAWGDRHLELKRGNLRQKHWQEVADAVNASHGTVKEAQRTVNASHGTVKEAQRTDIQCKNRIDTLKKKYKLEKARILGSGGTVKSNWRFYDQLDALVGDYVNPKKCQHQPAPLAVSIPYRKTQLSLPHELVIPVGVRSSRREKRSSISVNDSFSRRNYSAVAAAAAADPVDSDSSRSSSESSRPRGDEEVDGIMEMAQAILGFAEIYERVEEEKQRKILELEKERIEFMKKLEYQRMQLIMDSQIQIEKIKRAKRASTTDIHE